MLELTLAIVVFAVGIDEARPRVEILGGPWNDLAGLVGPHAVVTYLVLALKVLLEGFAVVDHS